MGQSIVEILIRASNQASGEFKKATSDLGALGKEAEKLGKGMRKTGAAITAGVTVPLAGAIVHSAMAAARVDELIIANNQLAKSAGYSGEYVQKQAESVKSMGIESAAAQQIVSKFITANLDLSQAANLARVAQDQAVISGENSTETMMRLTDALITGNTQMFRSMNMTLDLNTAYQEMADQLGKNVGELSETEKVQARVNAVMEYGTTIAGTYEAAMGDSYKQMGSFKRVLNDIAVEAGQYFTPALNTAVFETKDLLGTVKELISEGGALEPVLAGWGEQLEKAAGLIGNVDDALKNMDPATAKTIGDLTALTAVLGGIMLVGSGAVIWAGKLVGALGTLGLGSAAALGPIAALAAAMLAAAGVATHQKNKFEEVNREIIKSSETYEDYVRRTVKAANEQGWIIDENGKAWHAYTGELNEAYSIMGPVEYALRRVSDGMGGLIDVTNLATEDLDEYFELVDGEWIPVQKRATEATDEATDAIDAHERALNRAALRAREYGGASDIAREALNKLGVEAEEQARLMDELTSSTEDKTAADLLLEEVNLRMTALWADNALTADSYNTALAAAHKIAQDYPAALSPLLEMFGEWGGKVQNISDLLHGIPSEIKVDIIQTWYEAQGGTWGGVGTGMGGSDTFGVPTGGPVYPGQAYRWREFGDEFFIPQERGYVIPHREAAAMAAGWVGPPIVNVTINTPVNMADRDFVEREFAPIIIDVVERAGRS